MTENIPPASSTAPSGDVPGQPFYDKTRAHLKELLHKQRILMRNLQAQEDAIFKKETDYLEDTPGGNIIVGFDSYTKGAGAGGGAAARKKGGFIKEDHRVFSRSSVSWGLGSGSDSPFETAQSTPVTAMAPTPMSSSFQRGGDGPSNHATPTSAGGGNNKNKKSNGEDSDGEREVKKARTTFGVSVRK